MLSTVRRPRAVRLLVVLSMLTVVGLASASTAASADPFAGHWVSVDTDGSNQTLDVVPAGRGGLHRIVLFDDVATGACGGFPATLHGVGVVSGDHMDTLLNLGCAGGGRITGIGLGFDYRGSSDTLLDGFGVVWFRG